VKPILGSVFLLASLSLVAVAQKPNDPFSSLSTGPIIDKLEQQWDDALTKSDSSALENLYDATLVYTHSTEVDTKSSYINAIKSGATMYEWMKRNEIRVNLYNQSAVVTCHWQVRVNGVNMNARYRHVYVQTPDGWKLVAHQSTRISQ
jgi:hypothetical protein